MKPKLGLIPRDQIEKEGRPSLVIMEIAQRMINREEEKNPTQPKVSELQKGKIALSFVGMNDSPRKHRHFRRYMDNVGDIQVRGYDPITGRSN